MQGLSIVMIVVGSLMGWTSISLLKNPEEEDEDELEE